MSQALVEKIKQALSQVPYPGFQRDIVSFGLVKEVQIEAGIARVRLVVKTSEAKVLEALEKGVREALAPIEGLQGVQVQMGEPAPARLPTPGQPAAGAAGASGEATRAAGPDAAQIIGVASGKGGVGKSTVAVNLAVALAQAGKRVGFLDADVHGPSAPLLFGLEESKPEKADDEGRPLPLEAHGVKIMSMGFFVERSNAVIWRGPIVGNFIRQLLSDVAWGELDVLVIDFPPGTGDAQLTISQTLKMTGSIIVTTPNELALIDALKGISMFRKVEVPVLGLVENMAYFVCPSCETTTEIFGKSKVEAAAKKERVPVIGRIPIDPDVVADSDGGLPVVVAHPESAPAKAYRDIAARAVEMAEAESKESGGPGAFLDRFGG